MKTADNVCVLLKNREIGNDNPKRKDLQVLRTLITKGNRTFEKKWSKTSNKAFQFESGMLFAENYRTCYYGYTRTCGLRRQCSLPKENGYVKCKLEDALIYRCYHENFQRFENRRSLIGLLSREMGECLVLYDLCTGQLTQEIFLSRAVRFKYLSWVEPNEILVVKSTHLASDNAQLRRAAGISVNVAMVMAVFSAFPLQFIGMFQIDRQIFGPGITTAMLSHGLLIIMYLTGHVRFYSFHYILEHYKHTSYDIQCATHQPGSGLPMNIKITECPPVLFETRCEGQDVNVGGFPWHYIITPHGCHEIFQICSLNTYDKAKNGRLENHHWIHYLSTEPDRCCFHDDNSGRIVHVRTPDIRILTLQSKDSTDKAELVEVATLQLLIDDKEGLPQVTSSGRCVKNRRVSTHPLTIHQVDYEDELDLLCVTATYHGSRPKRVVRFYDNQSFKLLREIEIPQQFEEVYEYTLFVDLDTIVEIVKPKLGMFVCTVYRLSGDFSCQSFTQVNKTSKRTCSTSKSQPNSSRRRSSAEGHSSRTRRVTRTRNS